MTRMQAVQILQYGAPDVLVMREVDRPSAGAGEVLIRLSHAGVSFGDTYMRRGYYKPPHTYPTRLPYIPGIDGVGTIAEIGANAEGLEVGDVVTYVLGHHSYAQFVNVPAWKVIKIPASTSAEIACALMINGMTAYYLTHLLFPLGPQHTCLVHAGAGSVGQLVIQLVQRRGARVMTTVGTPEKERIVRDLGVDTVIRYREVDFVEAVRAATGGKGVDVVYDSVGLETYRRSMKCLKPRGTCSLYGAASGIPDCVRPMEDLAENGSIFVTRSHLAHYITNAVEARQAAALLFDLHRKGGLTIAIDERHLPLERAADAHRSLEARETTGKIILQVP